MSLITFLNNFFDVGIASEDQHLSAKRHHPQPNELYREFVQSQNSSLPTPITTITRLEEGEKENL